MFNLDGFLDLLARNRYSKVKLAKTLGISLSSLYRRLEKKGDFTMGEVRLLMSLFGRDEILNVFFVADNVA